MRWGLLACSWLMACAAQQAPAPSSRSVTYLTPTEHLVRASMALRGTRPSVEELGTVAADPGKLAPIVDSYLNSPGFAATVRELHNEVLLLHIQRPDQLTPAPVGPIANRTFDEISRSYYDEPLRLIEDVVMTDQPYTHIVTADYTMADPIVAGIYGMAHSDAAGWERAAWPDGRPAAGILVSDAFHNRYRSAGINFHRGRANAIARSLLCHNFLDGDVLVDASVNLADRAAVATAVVNNPSCAACHQTLDALASYFFGYAQDVVHLEAVKAYPFTIYDASGSLGWAQATGRPPGFFGHDAAGLDGLGRAIAADPRFARCAVTHFAAYLTEVDAAQLPDAWLAALQTAFVASGYNAKQLARAIVLSDRFRVASDGDPTSAEVTVGYQKARPAQLARMLEDLTGYRWVGDSRAPVRGEWTTGAIDFLDDDLNGFRVLGGGIDSFLVTQPVHTMNATSSMVSHLAAYRAASYVVAHDASVPAIERALFSDADVTATDEASVRAELAALHARIFGELAPAPDELDAAFALWSGALAAAGGDAKRAWIVTLTGMLSDVKAVYY